ncbi:MAG: GNAT family N-acetyltransferase [Alphaproteobacteria bacterium]|nr:GNAT family N-acetyltransferase [Alphaproteobacteria bacterium]NCQ88932.1 GNAT family N-acetyltransferase [Alphaproteobacteria bacterium]NCT07834.1 GNAT family N-acetyltransferase [Alphaproteobacteria bacterium]
MFKIVNLDSNSVSLINSNSLLENEEVKDFLISVQCEYPNIFDWYNGKVLSELEDHKRHIISYRQDSRIIGLGIAKKSISENKICTIKVATDFWGKGVGSMLVENLVSWLDDPKPVITVSENKYQQFLPLFKKFDFKTSDIKLGLYKPRVSEIIMNETKSKLN